MPKKRKPGKPELESQEMPKVKVDDGDSDFDMEDDVSEDDGDLFDSMSIKDDGADIMDEPDEDDLEDFDDDDVMSDSVSLDAAALADDPANAATARMPAYFLNCANIVTSPLLRITSLFLRRRIGRAAASGGCAPSAFPANSDHAGAAT